MLPGPEEITPRHRDQPACIYSRQSSPGRVQHHRESRVNQHALVERAAALGRPAARVRGSGADLGQSGQASSRPGFREAVAEVSLGQVGLALAHEASRLARNTAARYARLDLAAPRGALIADAGGVYDPGTSNDRPLRGPRGRLSEAGLPRIQSRMVAGRQRQVERGAYRRQLPTGLVRSPGGRVAQGPDGQVQRTLELVFARFTALGSCAKVGRRFRDEGLRRPRRQAGGPWAGGLQWKRPPETAGHEILHDPADAGAFVHGRRRRAPARPPGQPARRLNQPPTAWPVIQRGAYPAYIDWAPFTANQERLADNASRCAARRRGAVRAGPARLVGLVTRGARGRQLLVEHKAAHRHARAALSKEYGVPTCEYLGGPGLDAAVETASFAALQPAELARLDEVLAAQRTDHARLARPYADQVTRAEYEARLARRPWLAAGPANRLVAAELERRWEVALRGVAEAREAAGQFGRTAVVPPRAPTPRAQLSDRGAPSPALGTSGRLGMAHEKEWLRCLLRRVVVRRPRPGTVGAMVVWGSGATTRLPIHPPVAHTADPSD